MHMTHFYPGAASIHWCPWCPDTRIFGLGCPPICGHPSIFHVENWKVYLLFKVQKIWSVESRKSN